jgi:hypothetical protein
VVRFGYFLSSEEQRPEALVRQARLAEQAGFEGLRISDHYHPWLDEQGQNGFVWSETRSTIIDREAAQADPPLTISPEGMYRSQLNGKACINCNKVWPAPRVQVGVFEGGGRAMACPECAPVVVAE